MATDEPRTRLALVGLGAAVAAATLNVVVAALARSAGVDLEVTGGEAIPVSGIAFVTVVLSVVGLLIAAALSRGAATPSSGGCARPWR